MSSIWRNYPVAALACLALFAQEAPAQAPPRYMFHKMDLYGFDAPWNAVVADFNRDGRLDLAAGNVFDGSVSIFMANADGTFTAWTAVTGLSAVHSLEAADVNGDGFPDLLIHDAGENIYVYLGAGDGTFTQKSILTNDAFFFVAPLVVADFDGDGRMDLAICGNGNHSMPLYLGNGDGTFTLKSTSQTGSGPQSIVSGDFNGDGNADVALGDDLDGTVTVLLGRGDGTFEEQPLISLGSAVTGIAAADFNRDGRLDLAVTEMGGSVVILDGAGDGSFQPAFSTYAGKSPNGIVAGDFHGGGIVDLATVNEGDDTVTVLLGDGNGAFTRAPGLTLMAGENTSSSRAIALGDFNRDGHLDLAVTNVNDFTVSILIGNGDGSFLSGSVTSLTHNSEPEGAVAADFNGDGNLDLAVMNTFFDSQPGELLLLTGNGDGTFTMKTAATLGNGPVAIVTADFNGDGKPDVAVANAGDRTIQILLGDGQGNFATKQTLKSGGISAMVAGDLNGDLIPDLAVLLNGTNQFAVFLGQGDGSFKFRSLTATVPFAVSLALGDFNNDGKLDVAVADNHMPQAGSVSVLLGNGDGTFNPPSATFTTVFSARQIIAADFRLRGTLDLAVTNGFGVTVFAGNGDGTFGPRIEVPTGLGPSYVLAGDFNGDGKPDIATGDPALGAVEVAPGNGDGTFQPAQALFAGSPLGYVSGVLAGDFNNDGGQDLAAVNSGDEVILFLNRPVLAMDASRKYFAPRKVGTTGPFRRVTLTNISGVELAVAHISTAGANAQDFSASAECPAKLAPGGSCQIGVRFAPSAQGLRHAVLVVETSAPGGASVALAGIGE